MSPKTYEQLLRDLLSRESAKVRDANRQLYAAVVAQESDSAEETGREADLALARAAA